MNDDLAEIAAPPAPAMVLTANMVGQGPRIPAQQQIVLYSASQWEEFIQEWVHSCLSALYKKVRRFSGANDRGIDIAGLTDDQGLQGVWDNYQCKHYNHALYPTDISPEIGKVLWHSFKGFSPSHPRERRRLRSPQVALIQ